MMALNAQRQFLQKYEELCVRYLQSWTDTWAKLNNLANSVGNNGDFKENLHALCSEFHKLAGSGATYGFPSVTRDARDAENCIKNMLDAEQKFSQDIKEEIGQYISSIDDVLADALKALNPGTRFEESNDLAANRALAPKIVILDTDTEYAASLAAQLEKKKHEILVWDAKNDPFHIIEAERPQVVISNYYLGNWAGIDLCKKVKSELRFSGIIFIFLGSETLLQDRWKSVRAGGDSFFSKPVTLELLTDYLDKAFASAWESPIRITLVEDDTSQACFWEMILSKAGYHVDACNSPEEALNSLENFHPDLLLIDVGLPGIDGFELAEVIRQDPHHLVLPIIFMTANTNMPDNKIQATQVQGDEFLTKPVTTEHLLACIRSRSQKAIQIREMFETDSLTRILNRSSLFRQLDRLIGQCTRYKENMSVGIIDIDHFKNINDTHGHQAGDYILTSLVQFIRENIRISDIFGRYGGEEFVLLFPSQSKTEAANILEKLLSEFREKEYLLPNGETVTVSFSGGVAEFPSDGNDRDQVFAAADTALYTSKNNGRGRISITPEKMGIAKK